MAADQRKKKRVNAASLVGCTSREKYLVNKKKKPVQQHDLNMRPNISLEWDNKKKSVVPKKEQIGFSKRHLIPFIEPGSQGHNILADVLPVPPEIFELENLYEVMSYEVWQRHLSDDERRFLAQFLPKEVEPDKTVQDLLSGDSFHFGNPFIKWSASLCLGDLHPDDVLHDEQSLKAAKQAYYSFREKYHNDMIGKLEMWKEKWSSCKDLEVDIMENIWSSRKHGEKTLPASDARFSGTEENHVATPDSCSWANSEIAYSSENQNLGTVQGEPHRRRDLSEKISDSSSSGQKLVATAPRKGEKLHKQNIQQNDGAKYMSYIKVSREQHERVKSSIKCAGNSIQSRSLNNVLGSFDALNVQPFARFEEEESKKLHGYWVRFVTKDIPVGFANWRKMQLQRQEQTRSLCAEIGQKVELQETLDEGKDFSSSNIMELSNAEGEVPLSNTFEEVEKEQSDDLLQEQNGNEGPGHEMATEAKGQKEISNSYIYEKHLNYDTEMNEDDDAPNHVVIREQQVSSLNTSPSSSPGFLQDQHQHQHQHQIGSLGHVISARMESHGSAKDEHPQSVSGYLGNMVPSSSDVWPVGDARSSYYTPYASYTHELLIGHPPFMQEQAVQMLNLETVRQLGKQDRRQTTDVMPLFSSYSNQDRSELLHSLFKGQSNLSYHQQMQKHDFQCGNDVVVDTAHFSDMMRQKRPNDAYLHQESMYAGGRFAVPRQEDFPVNNNVHDWATSVRMNIGELGQNCWYSASSSSSSSAACLNSGDQTLFSVLSECNELPRGGGGGGVGGQLMGNYNSGGGSSNNLLAQSSNYSSGYEMVSKMNNLGWMGMGMPQQNSGIQDSIDKPFLRSWNQ